MDKRYAPKQLFLGLLFSNSHCRVIKNSSIHRRCSMQKYTNYFLIASKSKRISNRTKSGARIWVIMGHTGSITAGLSAKHTTNLGLCLFFSPEIKVDVASSGYVLIWWSWSVFTGRAFHKCWRCELSRKERRLDYPFDDFEESSKSRKGAS